MAETINFTSTVADNQVSFDSSNDTYSSISFEGQVSVGPQGEQGDQGIQGDPGEGVPTGGTANQGLTKIDGTDHNTQWSTIDKTFVGLSNVDNTSDASKPISTATQTALDAKAASSHTHTESDITDLGTYLEDITGEDLTDLADVTITTPSNGQVLKYNGSAWINDTDASGGSPAWGDITGTLSDQTDLQTALDGKSGTAHTHLLAAGATDVTASAAELNTLDGITATTAELNYTDGVTSAIQTQLDGKVTKAGDTMTGALEINRDGSSSTTNIEFNNSQAGGRADITWMSDLGNPVSKISAHTSDDASSDQTHWQVYTYKADLVTAMSVLAIQSHTNTPIATFNNLSKLQVSSNATDAASRLYITRQAVDGSPDETNSVLIEKRASGGAQLQDIASTGNALFDIDPIASDGTSSASLRLFRNTNTTGTRSLAVYKGDNTSTVQHFFNAAGNSYVNNNTGNFGIGNSSPAAKLDVTGEARVSTAGTNSTSVVTVGGTQTLTNKRITPRVGTTASSATPTINTDSYDAYSITALAADITSFTTNLSGTPTDFQKLMIRIKDDGTARAITWGASFEAKGVALPTTTVISKVLTVGFMWDSVTTKWGCIASAQEA